MFCGTREKDPSRGGSAQTVSEKLNCWEQNWTPPGLLDRRACLGAFTAETTVPGKANSENFRHCSEKLLKHSLDLSVKWSL